VFRRLGGRVFWPAAAGVCLTPLSRVLCVSLHTADPSATMENDSMIRFKVRVTRSVTYDVDVNVTSASLLEAEVAADHAPVAGQFLGTHTTALEPSSRGLTGDRPWVAIAPKSVHGRCNIWLWSGGR